MFNENERRKPQKTSNIWVAQTNFQQIEYSEDKERTSTEDKKYTMRAAKHKRNTKQVLEAEVSPGIQF